VSLRDAMKLDAKAILTVEEFGEAATFIRRDGFEQGLVAIFAEKGEDESYTARNFGSTLRREQQPFVVLLSESDFAELDIEERRDRIRREKDGKVYTLLRILAREGDGWIRVHAE